MDNAGENLMFLYRSNFKSIETKSTKKLTEANLNANAGKPYSWFKDNNSLLIKAILEVPLIEDSQRIYGC